MDVNAMRPAGFWIRLVALIVDGLVLLVPNCMLMALIGRQEHASALMLATQLVSVAYTVGFLSSSWQATPGKRLLKIYVVGEATGQRIGQARALARYLVLNALGLLMLIPTMGPPAGLQDLSPESQRQLTQLQDKVQHSEKMSPEETQRFSYLTLIKVIDPQALDTEDREEFMALRTKVEKHETLTQREGDSLTRLSLKNFLSGKNMLFFGIGLLSCVYGLVIAFTVGLTRYKTGIHDMICKTRAVRGRPDELAPVI